MQLHPIASRGRTVPLLGLIVVASVSACSSSSSSSPPPPTPATSTAAATASSTAAPGTASDVAQITTDWNAFFTKGTPASKRVQLLQNGSQFSSVVTAWVANPLLAGAASKVDSVTLTSGTQATVKYDLTAIGTPVVAPGTSGTAILQDSTWKVSDATFCGLIKQAVHAGILTSAPAACASAG
jgi:hypothetical protein